MRSILLLTLCAALACSGTSSGVKDPEPLVEGFVAVDATSGLAPAGATNPPTVRVVRGGIEVLGLMAAPDLCQEVRGELARQGQDLVVTITATSRLVLCAQALGTYAYRVAEAVPSGTYTLKVRYVFEYSDWPGKTVVDTAITVP